MTAAEERGDGQLPDLQDAAKRETDRISSAYGKLQVLESDGHPLNRLERLSSMNGPMLAWYEGHARILPWRENPSPYRVWISEIMLQQTRVEAVKPYFQRFLAELPDVKALAEVPEERLLKLWEGLGYYNRARNLRKAAGIMMSDYQGRVPDEYEELQKLPGIGRYTAGAVVSIAYGKPEPAVDGNVLRVLSRVLASREDIRKESVKRQFESDLRQTMSADRAGAFNQSLFEIGAVVCVPNGAPRCGQCPLSGICLTNRGKLWNSIPYKAALRPRKVEERTILLIESGNFIAIRKRPDTGLLASLYEFPGLEGRRTAEEVSDFLREAGSSVIEIESAGESRHIFSHVEWHMTGYLVKVNSVPETYLAVERQEIRKYPLPNAFQAYIRLINGES